ncbi:MAG: gamma subclass chorismate mutase AroQ [Pseudomonadota bacterium]
MSHVTLLLLIVLVSAGPVWAKGTSDDIKMLRRLLIERLALMEDVAAYKWNAGLPIDDPAREANVHRAAEARARAAGLAPARARAFIAAQMEAAKIIQRYHFDEWRANGVEKIEGVPDLATDLRPRIGALSRDLIVALAADLHLLEDCQAASTLRPAPDARSGIREAWEVAIGGVLEPDQDCPAAGPANKQR